MYNLIKIKLVVTMQVVVVKNKNQQHQHKNRRISNYCYNSNSIVNQIFLCHRRWLNFALLLLVAVVCFNNNKITSCQAFSILNPISVGASSSKRSMTKTPTMIDIPTVPATMEGVGQSGRNSINYSLGGKLLREIVIDATVQDTMIDESSLIDLQGIVWLEHINLIIGSSKELGQFFYGTFLGCTPDASKSFHMNMGQQQFHLAVEQPDNPTQTICGSIGLAVPNLQSIRNRIQDALIALNNTQFAILYDNDDDDMLTVRCPWGNIFHLYDIRKDDHFMNNDNNDAPSSTIKKMVQSHSIGGPYGPHRMAVRGKPGIRYVEFTCPKNLCPKIAHFYRKLLDCTVREQEIILNANTTTNCAIVNVGPGVQLIFIETTTKTTDNENNDFIEALNRMKGVHICIYVPNFVKLYNRLNCINPNSNKNDSNNSIIWTNPRFVHLDTCETIAEAIASRTLRFKDIIDIDSNNDNDNNVNNEQQPYNIVYELEHETRALTHGQYMKVPNYEPR